MRDRLHTVFLAVALMFGALMADAQSANVSFGGLRADTGLPVEITAESLEVNQADGTATFVGDVLVVQGEMRLQAGKIKVVYDASGAKIDRLLATGGVLIVNATDAAEAAEAVYTIGSGQVVMTGNVLMTQGQAAIKGEKLVINLQTGTGRMEGGVSTTFTPGGN